MTEAHTPGPWVLHDYAGGSWRRWGVTSEHSLEAVARFTKKADARRAVAAVNACEGISTDALEAGVLGELVAALREVDRMVGEATNAPATADRWLDRIEETAREALAKLEGKA